MQRVMPYRALSYLEAVGSRVLKRLMLCLMLSWSAITGEERLRRNLDSTDHGVVGHGNKREFDLALSCWLNIAKCLYYRFGATLSHDVEVLQDHASVAGYIEDSAAGAAVSPVMCSKPWFEEKQSDTIKPG